MIGFEKYLAQMIIMIRQCVAYKNHDARSKVKVTRQDDVSHVRTMSLGQRSRLQLALNVLGF